MSQCGGSGCGSPGSAVQQDAFGCTVTNRFDRLLDDDAADPFDILRQAEVERQRRKKKEEAKRGNAEKAAKKPESQKDRRAPPSASARAEQGHNNSKQAHVAAGCSPASSGQIQNENKGMVEVERGERRAVFRERRLNVMEPPQQSFMDRPVHKLEMGNYTRGTGRMGYLRNTDGFDQKGKREFDRQSGSYKSSVRPGEKRDGNGPRNWGSIKDPVSYELEGTPTEQGGCPEEADEVMETDGENRSAEGEGESTPEVTVEMTLDEWKSFQEQSRPKVEFNLRKADSSVFSKAVVIHKSKYLEGLREGLNEDEDAHFFRRPANDITYSLDINFGSLARPSRGGRGGRGGRGRGGSVSRTETVQSEVIPVLAPNPDDMEDFPALA
ncbi:intracellular hyaluronan-binding protein 4 isoform X1 [Scleropages formosus]|uniref:Zgc:103482 n=1 Tax=Scleropages formosus TaxID=113540 RepID=A0A8C9RBA3_SCLFO|nr:intracellular hyaluronan-binding protein 4-like isoform X1 [Scleropages formosus]